MEHTYSILKANHALVKGTFFNFKHFTFLIKNFIHKLRNILIFLICFVLTIYIFKIYVTENTIENIITVGALLSTLGSCLVSMASAKCEKNMMYFNNNSSSMSNLQKEFNAKWERKPYEKRVIRHKYSKNQYEYTFFNNAIVTFEINNWEVKIDIPSSDKDFYEIRAFYNYIKLTSKRNTYRKYLNFYKEENITGDIFVWDNLQDLYKNIIDYRIFAIMSVFGWSIVINSLLFSFFYHYAMPLLNF